MKDNVTIYHLTESLFKIIYFLLIFILLKSCNKTWLALDCLHHIREFPSIAEAQRTTGINQSNIGVICRGLQAYAGRYHWKYVECNDT